MRVLILGSGGREHALARALAGGWEVAAWPGSDAIHAGAAALPATVADMAGAIAWARAEGCDLCIPGGEDWLAAGAADLCAAAGIPCWGPGAKAARLETSKIFAKNFMLRHGIPTAPFRAVRNHEEAHDALAAIGLPAALKYDGPAGGKGVVVCPSAKRAEPWLRRFLVDQRFGPGPMLIERALQGPELSIICAVADGQWRPLPPARDWKRAHDGDRGPNTGGMGSVAGPELATPELLQTITTAIIAPTLRGLSDEGLAYRGFLYFGLMLTDVGPQVLEFNCRLGDPEAQAQLPLIEGDLGAWLAGAARGDGFDDDLVKTSAQSAASIVLASSRYPYEPSIGERIEGIREVEKRGLAQIIHAGTQRRPDGGWATNAGRVLCVCAQGPDVATALATANAEADRITFPGMQRRSDIGRSPRPAAPADSPGAARPTANSRS